MQPQRSSGVDLIELKTQIVKRVGVEKSKKYFHCLNRFLSQKLSKSEFDRSCFHLLGRENLSLHNQLIRSILKNACKSKAPLQICKAGPTESVNQTTKRSPGREDVHEPSGSLVPNQSQNVAIWSNGVLPVSPRKVRSGIRDRKLRDRTSALGPNGKVDSLSQQPREGSGGKVIIENGEFTPCDYQRPMQHIQGLAEQSQEETKPSLQQPTVKLRTHSNDQAAIVDYLEETEQPNHFNFSRGSLIAPLGIPYCPASVGGARKALPVASSGFICCDSGQLSDTDTLRKRMEQIAAAQGLEGVSMECANLLNGMLDVYLKRLIRSCVELAGARSVHDPRKHTVHKQQVPGKLINGIWSSNHLLMPGQNVPLEMIQELRLHSSISMLDFKVAMEMNPQQLGENWPLLLEKICNHAFED